jgi:DNA-binding CsgD family transcriptional regulator
MPCIDMIRKGKLDARTTRYIDLIESSLNEIVSPFIRTLSSKYLQLTPKEILIAGFLKSGKATKEIAELLNTSTRGIEFHRENLRLKLGLKNKKENLRSYLRSIPMDE